MLIGVISDTHNNIKNIDKIIGLFNEEKVSSVIHSGDIANAEAFPVLPTGRNVEAEAPASSSSSSGNKQAVVSDPG